MPNKVFIHATNVHQGGGRSLLEALLQAIHGKAEFVLFLDQRMPIPENGLHDAQIKRIKPSILQRWRAEKELSVTVAAGDTVLCFGNLPPLFRLPGRTVVFVQNRYLIDDVKLSGFPLRVRLRLAIERLWLDKKMSNVSEFVVQTPTMKRLLEFKTQGSVPVRVLPFAAGSDGDASNMQSLPAQTKLMPKYDFIYIASGEPHKNHRRLIEAWRLLAEDGVFPSLCLTLDRSRFAELYTEIEVMRQRYGLKIINAGEFSHERIFALYGNAGALIYPSTFESFGLPLIEARQAGLAVLAAELDYVRDVLAPEQTFDPYSPISIARAVKRHLGVADRPLQILDAASFLDRLVSGGSRTGV
ncbi:glycosyltransferase [Candidatus Methylobacter oryzae]|uniref:Glycosyltransferase family 4 protein n=1 Tax=Candidatus Methylobacter oryzae TaxID=2497749 RepID=A0ABY3CB81_9GAMM|nr:glycosyltransferase [Candidatus Methylobacter oryzae]TRW92194.1 glycosyltransferase family 4 protein [Candidatus Methylobacter oryzae]